MVRNFRDLWGTMATGLIFSCVGGLCLMSPHRTSWAQPLLIFCRVSSRSEAMASGGRAETWGPRFKAAVMCCLDHGCPQSTGQPCCPQESSMGAAGWESANERGHMVLPVASRVGENFGIVSSRSRVSMMVASISSGVWATDGG